MLFLPQSLFCWGFFDTDIAIPAFPRIVLFTDFLKNLFILNVSVSLFFCMSLVNRTYVEVVCLFVLLPFHLKILAGLHQAGVRDNEDRTQEAFTQFQAMLAFCKAIGQYHNSDIDMGSVEIQKIPITPRVISG